MPSASNKIGKLLLTPTLPLKGDTECLCTPFAADGSVRRQVLSINIQEKKWKQLSQMKPFRMKMIFHDDLDPQATNLLFATNADAITEITQLASRHDFYALFTIESADEPVLFYMGEKPLERRSAKTDEADFYVLAFPARCLEAIDLKATLSRPWNTFVLTEAGIEQWPH